MSQAKDATSSAKTEPSDKRCTCPVVAPAATTARKGKQRKSAKTADQEGFLIRLVPSPGHDLSALRRPPAPQRVFTQPVAQPPPAVLLVNQPPMTLVPPFAGAPYLASPSYLPLAPGCQPLSVTAVANAPHSVVGNDCGGCHNRCSHRHCCSVGSSRGDYSAQNTLTIPPYAMPFFGEVYRSAAAAPAPQAGGGNINVVTKVVSDDKKRKRRGKKQRRDSSSDSSDSYSRKRRKSGPTAKKDEPQQPQQPQIVVVPTAAPPASPPPPREEPAPTPAAPTSPPPVASPPSESHVPFVASPGSMMYPQSPEDQHTYDNLPSRQGDEENAEGEEEKSPNKLACICVVAVVGVCVIIAIVLALYPSILFGKKNNGDGTTAEARGLLGRAATALDNLNGRVRNRVGTVDYTVLHSSEKLATTPEADVENLAGTLWRRT